MKITPIIQLGIGNVGREVIRNVLEYKDYESNRLFRYIGIANSTSYLFRQEGIPDRLLEEIISAEKPVALSNQPDSGNHNGDLSPLLHETEGLDSRYVSIIDATDSETTTSFLLGCAVKGMKMVLANKKPLVRDIKIYRLLKQVPLGLRATIGAGLPVIPAIEKVLSQGKKILKIEGCFSGSLGILCSSLETGEPFSEVVKALKNKGYTEPDPREDLSGRDMARKILILSRLSGYKPELHDVITESLFPEEMVSLPPDIFLSEIRTLDEAYRERFTRALHKKYTLRFVATMENGTCRIGLREVPVDSVIGRLKGAEKLAVLYTHWNHGRPIVIRGSGAGAKSAAKDVFDDLLDLQQKAWQ